ncbi:MAG: ABC transporter permease, partial [Candidatus Sumerlaeia bacterium]|nr:ABC transporter permease [Candidatus Sumerlaeia bacterium]
GVALGVGVLVAIDLANESAVESFRRSVDDVAGSAQLEVRGNGVGMPGDTFAKVARHPGITAIEPVISGDVTFSGSASTTESLLLLGVDLLGTGDPKGNTIREISFSLHEDLVFQDLLTNSDNIILTERFARRHGLSLGDRVELVAAGFPGMYTIAGVIGAGSIADTLDGNLAVVDLAVADIMLRRRGLLDRIEIRLAEGLDVDRVAEELAATLGGGLVVERPQARSARVDNMVAAFRFNLRALGHISILVGAFLVYNTMSIAVLRRRPVIGTVRALGVSRGAVRLVFLLEGALMGIAGSVLGIIGGVVTAGLLLRPVSEAISINFVQIHGASLVVGWGVLFQAVTLGVGGALVAALGPASDAASTPPANSMRRGSGEVAGSAVPWKSILVGLILALAGMAILSREPRPGLPVAGYLASTFIIGAFAFWSRPFLALISSLAHRPASRFFGAEGLVAVAATRAAIGRSSIAISGLLVSVAMTISVTVMVASFRVTVTSWMEQVLVADLYISPAAAGSGADGPTMPAEFAHRISSLDGVEAVDPFRTWTATIDGQSVRIGSGDFRVPRFTSEDSRGRPMQDVLALARERQGAVVSEAFANKHGREEGDLLVLPTPSGPRELEIIAVYTDYSSEQGYVIFDRNLYNEWFGDELINSVAVYLGADADRDGMRSAIRAIAHEMEGVPGVVIRSNDELRGFALEAFDRTFAVTHILKVIAILVSVLGVTTTLLAQVVDRRQELSTLRYLGATRRRIGKIIVLETGLIIKAGLILGLPSGLIMSWILTRFIMLESFGWTIAFVIPWLLVAQVCVIIFVGSLLAGILPAREAMRSSGDSSSGLGR